jgi:hypothetical protein
MRGLQRIVSKQGVWFGSMVQQSVMMCIIQGLIFAEGLPRQQASC